MPIKKGASDLRMFDTDTLNKYSKLDRRVNRTKHPNKQKRKKREVESTNASPFISGRKTLLLRVIEPQRALHWHAQKKIESDQKETYLTKRGRGEGGEGQNTFFS